MKTKIFNIIIAFLISLPAIAQNGINYKAIVKDGSGNVVANDLIQVQFSILQGAGLTNVYSESHSPTTDANGLIVINISEGIIISGDYTMIDWASDTHFLNVQINTGGGLVDMGTTEFKTVPYALQSVNATNAINADNATTANNVTGLETIDEGNGIGWRLVGMNPFNYGNIGEYAVDFSYSDFGSISHGATGVNSFASGSNTEASGSYSTAMGKSTKASGHYSTALGTGSEASGEYSFALGYYSSATGTTSFAMGWNAYASGYHSTAIGSITSAHSSNSTAIGQSNIGGGDPSNWVDTDPLFEIGNGNLVIQRNALTVLKSGTHIMNSYIDASPEIILGGTANTATGDNGILSSDPSYSSSDIFLRSYDAVVIQLDYDGNEAGQFEIKNGAGAEIFEVDESGNVSVNGSIVHASDRRLKKDIEDLPYGLKEILQLQPKAYHWKNSEQKNKSLGLIAQEVQPIIKEVVSEKDNEEKTLGIKYTQLIPILINAIKEQQVIIENQNNNYSSLETRIEALENKNDAINNLASTKK